MGGSGGGRRVVRLRRWRGGGEWGEVGLLLEEAGGGGEPWSLHSTPLSVRVLRLCRGDFLECLRGRTGGGEDRRGASMLDTRGGRGGPRGEGRPSFGTSRGLEDGSQT